MKKLFAGITFLLALLLLLCCLTPYIPVQYFPVLSLISLTVPLLVLVNLACLLCAWYLKLRIAWFSLAVLLIGYLALGTFYRIGDAAQEDIPEGSLSVLSYNTRSFEGYEWTDGAAADNEIIQFVKEQMPDVVCFQEFSRIFHRQLRVYPYRYETPYYMYKSTQAIFSKYPIVGSGSLNFPNSLNNAIYADILYHGDTLRIYNLHLQSYRLHPSRRLPLQMVKGRLYNRVAQTFIKQQEQAAMVEEHMASCPYKKILCGDFNNTQFSRVYRMVRGEMQDSYAEKGKGFGMTYKLKFLPLRIDAILADPSLEVVAHKNFDVRMSDHYPLMAAFRIKAKDSNNP